MIGGHSPNIVNSGIVALAVAWDGNPEARCQLDASVRNVARNIINQNRDIFGDLRLKRLCK
jgi:hypothetical protein